MNGSAYEVLELDPDTLELRVNFFASYAQSVLEAGPSSSGDFGRSPASPDWFSAATAATSLRFAAQFAMLFDVPRSRELLADAARLYVGLGLPYGYFLL